MPVPFIWFIFIIFIYSFIHIKTFNCLFLYAPSLQGTVNNQTGIFPQSFVKIIKPLPESDTEVEGEGHTYSCLRCFLLTPSGVDTRYVMCVYVRARSKAFGQKWTFCHTDIINTWHDCLFLQRYLRTRRPHHPANIQGPLVSYEVGFSSCHLSLWNNHFSICQFRCEANQLMNQTS